MNYLGKVFLPFYKELNEKVKSEDFVKNVENKTSDVMGSKVVELIAPKIVIDVSKIDDGEGIKFNSRKTPLKYLKKEKEWYNSESLNILGVDDVEIWTKICNVRKEINSNYGYLVYNKGNFNQFEHSLQLLKKDPNTRQAIVIYTRPSIHLEYNDLNGSDFICTNFQHFFIRNGKLDCITSMRSNDCMFGTFNDVPWFLNVMMDMHERLKETYPSLELGKLTFIPNSFHCYERHFELLSKIANEEAD